MPPNAVLQAVRRSNILFLVLGLICLLIVAAGFYLDRGLILGFLNGPRSITSGELSNITDADSVSRAWVTVTGNDAYDTGWQQYEENDGGDQAVTGAFVLLTVGKRDLLVKIPSEITADTSLAHTYTGLLVNFPDDVTSQVIPDIQQQEPSLTSTLLPIMLDTSDFHVAAYVALVLMAVGIILGLALLIVGTRRMIDPSSHPIMKSLARYGDSQAISDEINRELAANPTKLGKTVALTPHWLVSQGTTYFKAARLRDIAWMYENITRHRTYGITTRRTYEGYVYDRYGKLTNFAAKEQQVQDGLRAIAQAAPWAVMGYDAQYAEMWRKNRDQFLATVDQRRAQAEQK
ncbi:MAG TPA: DUF6709 family protein [Phototrophicaceae bacterium]|nr:DUF6709 family protein [Phototrophicaceae bacterium]